MRIRGKHYQTGVECDFVISNGIISSIEEPQGINFDLGGGNCWIAPGLIDLQVNGYKGYDFCGQELEVSDVLAVSELLTEAGVTGYCPTITTNPHETILKNLRIITKAKSQLSKKSAEIVGIHLEGPYISSETGPVGAHPKDQTRNPSFEEFQQYQQAAEGQIKVVTLAPELDGAIEFIAYLRKQGIKVGLGHHQAPTHIIQEAVRAGAVLSTHLGNGAHSILPRHPNYIWDQIAEDGLMASLILDGHHLPAAVVKTIFRAKGPDRIILISDMVFPAGMDPGHYQFMGLAVDVMNDGSIRSSGTPYLAGSSLKLANAIGRFVRFAGATFAEAISAATKNPAGLVDVELGSLEVGSKADLTGFDSEPEYVLMFTIKNGITAFSA